MHMCGVSNSWGKQWAVSAVVCVYAAQVMAEVGGMCKRRSRWEAVWEVSYAEVDAAWVWAVWVWAAQVGSSTEGGQYREGAVWV